MKHILFVASESAPFIKTGGLGSVMGSLPLELIKLGLKISLVIPGYECIDKQFHDQMEDVSSFPVNLGWIQGYVDLKKMDWNGVTYYFIHNSYYYKGDQPYGEIEQDIEKFAFFCKAVIEMQPYLDQKVDIIHCHDWQTGLLPVFLKTVYKANPYLNSIKTIMTIHNIQFQGVADINTMKDITGLPNRAFQYDMMASYGNANMLKGGIACADYVTTVSSSYAHEITTSKYGEGLDPLLDYRKEQLIGIVNGIDWNIYNPQADPLLESPYNKDNFVELRPANKLALQRKTGLPEDKNVFAMGIVSRLTGQKGYDLMEDVLEDALNQGSQLYVLGSGENWVLSIFLRYKERYPNQVYVDTDYSDEIAKAIYGGCDITLMPSRFEPCGLNQLMALRYGCLPLVRATGGLKDTVKDDGMISENGTGFVFDQYDKYAFFRCLERAMKMYHDHHDLWIKRMKKGMEEDFSWKSSSLEYEKLYNKML